MTLRRYRRLCMSALLLTATIFTLFSCMKDDEFTTSINAGLEFEKDTVRFDTVFTTIGSSTKRFKVFNRGDKGIRLTSVLLESGGTSGFRINVDGLTGAMVSDIEIPRKDSIFIFAEVTVNPQGSDTPQLLRDAIVFNFESGRQQRLVLEAWGQDIIVLKAEEITADRTLTSPRPYLIYDSLVVKEGATLTLAEGTTLCFHNEANLIVHGTLVAQGTQEKRVTLRGDRTDKMFSNLPYDWMDSQWGGVTLCPESSGNQLNFVDIHGGNYGIDCPLSTTDNQKLLLTNSIIHNVMGHGLSMIGCKAEVMNSQITNAGGDCVRLVGGESNFTHCTIVQLYPWDATYGKAIFFTNTNDKEPCPLLGARFYNCLITSWEWEDDAIEGSPNKDKEVAFEYLFHHCLIDIKLTGQSSEEVASHFVNCVNESGMKGDDVIRGKKNFLETVTYLYVFQLAEQSNARGIGDATYSSSLPYDLDGTERPADKPDAGCYQFKPVEH